MRSMFGTGTAVEIGDWPRLGGHLTLDLANTVSWRLDPARKMDYLHSVAALADWLHGMDPSHDGIFDRGSAASAERALDQLRELRDATIAALDSEVDGPSPVGVNDPQVATVAISNVGLNVVARYGQRAIAASSLQPGLPSRWVCEVVSPAELVHHVSLLTVTLLQSDRARRIRRCEGPGCGWFFLDTTRNHSRRWCASGDCGNRVRVRNYTQRRRNPPLSG
jgi:predicted RNA-binding Zn ribbon-like protein